MFSDVLKGIRLLIKKKPIINKWIYIHFWESVVGFIYIYIYLDGVCVLGVGEWVSKRYRSRMLTKLSHGIWGAQSLRCLKRDLNKKVERETYMWLRDMNFIKKSLKSSTFSWVVVVVFFFSLPQKNEGRIYIYKKKRERERKTLHFEKFLSFFKTQDSTIYHITSSRSWFSCSKCLTIERWL